MIAEPSTHPIWGDPRRNAESELHPLLPCVWDRAAETAGYLELFPWSLPRCRTKNTAQGCQEEVSLLGEV